MAVGDPVIVTGADNTAVTFTPAAGVTVMITMIIMDQAVGQWFLSAADRTAGKGLDNQTGAASLSGSMKLLVDNDVILIMGAQITNNNYMCGFQVA